MGAASPRPRGAAGRRRRREDGVLRNAAYSSAPLWAWTSARSAAFPVSYCGADDGGMNAESVFMS
ncbi:hypothetical protein EYF80_059368 [Liparis tanakae]|uniref:Uncharacterized protein n=1 Tax=Liparis tanakae TaxID=230148 RepID=A0A4Z2EPE9_9TELE|nr:hypothetical protein EYF80_059368 [Liparis tanakae]